jgi:hypothetical protein
MSLEQFIINEEKEYTSMDKCRKDDYCYYRAERAYCGSIYECVYKSDIYDDIGVRCMNLEKQI